MRVSRSAVRLLVVVAVVAAAGLVGAAPALAVPVGSTGTQNVLLMLAYWGSGSAPDSPTGAAVTALAGDVQEWFSSASYGNATVTVTPIGFLSIGGPGTSGCQAARDDLMQQAKDASGENLGQYQDFVLYFPQCAESPSDPASWSTLGGQGVWLNGSFTLHDVVSGIGHNMGVAAGTDVCTNGDMSSSCTVTAEADPFDPTGQGTTAGFNAAGMSRLGWLATGNGVAVTVRDMAVVGSTTLTPMHGTTNSVTVGFLNPGGGAWTYWLEYRQPFDVDNVLPDEATGGVLVHAISAATGNQPALVNTRADDGSGDIWTIPTGTSFFLKEGYRISVGAVSSSGAAITVTPPQQLTVTRTGTGSGTVTSNPAGITCGTTCTASYRIGTSVTLTAAPATGSGFAGWSGACTGTASTCTVSMSTTRSVTASFTPSSASARVEESAAGLDGWALVSTPGASGGTWRASSTKANTVTFRFTGTAVTLVSHKGPRQGIAAVTIDGVSKGNVDLYAASDQAFSRAFSGLASRAHTIVVKVTGTKNAAAATTEVIVDAFTVGATTTQDSAKTVTYDGWASVNAASASGGSYRQTAKANATATYTFTGTGIDWITATGRARGRASVSIDGGPAVTVDLYASAAHWKVVGRSFTGLSSGQHRITVKVLGTKNAASTGATVPVDAFVVR